ncbi:hypothetical protein HZC34_01330 [Candidatus Saganbacteria bacterium]|nr:hypothetical protein [Candidatus Saganbacteria bacterium]
MKNLGIILLIIFIHLSFDICHLTFASSSTSYKIASEVIDFENAASTSTSFRLLGKLRHNELTARSSTSFILGDGFLRSAYTRAIPAPTFAPIVTSIIPATGVNSGSVSITNLAGANFQSGATVKLLKTGQADIVAASVVVVSGTQITCSFDITGKAGGFWDVTVANTDGKSGTLPSAFTITYPAPTVTSITPAKGVNNSTVSITDLAGTNFRSGANVKLSKAGETDIIATNIVVDSATKITCQLNLSGKTVGPWDVIVTNDDNLSATLTSGFKIEAPTVSVVGPVISTQNPFNPSVGATSINYTLSKDTDIYLTIFNIRGEKVWERFYPAGTTGSTAGSNSITWDGMTDFRSVASFGVYIVIVNSKTGGTVTQLARTTIAITK